MIATPADPTPPFLPLRSPPPSLEAGRRPTRILVLDEDDATHSAVEMSVGDLAPIIHATNPVDAFRLVQEADVGIIVSARRLGSMDLTHLLCLVKRQHPEIISIVVGEAETSKLLGRLIAEEQIFQFVAKPLKAGSLRPCIKAALDQRATLLAHPAAPQDLAASPAAAADAGTPPASLGRSLAGRLKSLLRRLLWQ